MSGNNISQSTVNLSWSANDNIGIDYYVLREGSYEIYRGPNTSKTVEGLNSGSSYTFSVDAYDTSGNKSTSSFSFYTLATTTTTSTTTITTTTTTTTTMTVPDRYVEPYLSLGGLGVSWYRNQYLFKINIKVVYY